MEFLHGRDLVEHTRPGHLLPVATVIAIGEQVARALDYAHQRQVVHRDIKPANIMYDPVSETVKVTDFGIARITDASRTKTGMVLGTPSFMSPEQLAGQKIEGSSDLYSLGVTLFQLLTGALPLRGDSMAALMYQIANQPAPDPRSLRPELPSGLADILAQALSKSPQARFASGKSMADALRGIALTLPPEPSASPAPTADSAETTTAYETTQIEVNTAQSSFAATQAAHGHHTPLVR